MTSSDDHDPMAAVFAAATDEAARTEPAYDVEAGWARLCAFMDSLGPCPERHNWAPNRAQRRHP